MHFCVESLSELHLLGHLCVDSASMHALQIFQVISQSVRPRCVANRQRSWARDHMKPLNIQKIVSDVCNTAVLQLPNYAQAVQLPVLTHIEEEYKSYRKWHTRPKQACLRSFYRDVSPQIQHLICHLFCMQTMLIALLGAAGGASSLGNGHRAIQRGVQRVRHLQPVRVSHGQAPAQTVVSPPHHQSDCHQGSPGQHTENSCITKALTAKRRSYRKLYYRDTVAFLHQAMLLVKMYRLILHSARLPQALQM